MQPRRDTNEDLIFQYITILRPLFFARKNSPLHEYYDFLIQQLLMNLLMISQILDNWSSCSLHKDRELNCWPNFWVFQCPTMFATKGSKLLRCMTSGTSTLSWFSFLTLLFCPLLCGCYVMWNLAVFGSVF